MSSTSEDRCIVPASLSDPRLLDWVNIHLRGLQDLQCYNHLGQRWGSLGRICKSVWLIGGTCGVRFQFPTEETLKTYRRQENKPFKFNLQKKKDFYSKLNICWTFCLWVVIKRIKGTDENARNLRHKIIWTFRYQYSWPSAGVTRFEPGDQVRTSLRDGHSSGDELGLFLVSGTPERTFAVILMAAGLWCVSPAAVCLYPSSYSQRLCFFLTIKNKNTDLHFQTEVWFRGEKPLLND